MSQILKEDESARSSCQVIASQKASTLHEEENMECEKQQKKRVVEENVGTNDRRRHISVDYCC